MSTHIYAYVYTCMCQTPSTVIYDTYANVCLMSVCFSVGGCMYIFVFTHV